MTESKNTLSETRSFLSLKFLLAVIILVVAAIGLRPGMLALAKKYSKQSIAIRRPLKEFDASRMPSFRKGWKIKRHGVVDAVETDEYMHITFDREQSKQQPKHAELFVTYYNDPQGKVPHTPDVCSRQGGAILKKADTITIDTPELGSDYPQIRVRSLILGEPTYNLIEMYVFYVEGQFQHRREQVRWVIGKPGNKYMYFSKIDVAAVYPLGGDPAPATETCKKLMHEALPILLTEYFPTKQQVKGP